jgi:hypothetical protein
MAPKLIYTEHIHVALGCYVTISIAPECYVTIHITPEC